MVLKSRKNLLPRKPNQRKSDSVNNYSIKVTAEPAAEPITLEEAKSHLRVPTNDEDANISGVYIPAARRRIEAELGRALVSTTFEYSLDAFPRSSLPINLPRNPVQSVTSIVYIATDGTETTMPADDYVLDSWSEPGRIHPVYATTWPHVRRRTNGQTVKVTFVAGYGSGGVPQGILEAMLLLIGHYYYHREAVTVGTINKELPRAVGDLLASHSYGDEFVDYGGRH